MRNAKYIGITLLFFQRKKSNHKAFLKSYILSPKNWDDLQKKIKKMIGKYKTLTYLGIEDIFYVSGPFAENEILGKSYIDEITKIKDAKHILLKKEKYTYNFQLNKQKEKWFLFSLIYFYHDKRNGDKLTISCLTPILGNNIKVAKNKIKTICVTKSFLKKILPFNLDKMSYTNLKYIGIEDISFVDGDPKNGEEFECSYKVYNNLEEINSLLPSNKKSKKSFEQAIGF